jgi:hypothetical protein
LLSLNPSPLFILSAHNFTSIASLRSSSMMPEVLESTSVSQNLIWCPDSVLCSHTVD